MRKERRRERKKNKERRIGEEVCRGTGTDEKGRKVKGRRKKKE